MADEREILPPWTKAPCVSCGEEYQATRTEPGPVGECCECESYARGFEDGKKAAAAEKPAPSALERARQHAERASEAAREIGGRIRPATPAVCEAHADAARAWACVAEIEAGLSGALAYAEAMRPLEEVAR